MGLGFQVLEDGFCVGAVHVGLRHQREGDAVIEAAEFGDLVIGTGLLAGELVAGEAEDDESLVLVFLVEGLQAVILRGETAFGCGIDDHQDFPFVLGEVHFGTLVACGFEVVNLCHVLLVLGTGRRRKERRQQGEIEDSFHFKAALPASSAGRSSR